jgi:tripartite-type tricarboxylate transporter receptor subunit TctC
MPDPPSQARSVKIGADERTGWSSDRPRREGAPARPVDVSTRCRVLRPTDRMRYSPGSLVVVVSASPADRDAFINRVIEEKGAVFTLAKIRGLNEIARRMGTDLTSVAHHLALLTLPPELDEVLRSGRCTSPRTLYELAINPAVSAAPGYDVLRDFIPITQVISAYLVLDARPGLGVKSMKELISMAVARPGQLTCGSAGNATASHFALEVLKLSAKADITHVSYKGEAPLIADLLGGHVDIGFNVTTTALPHIKAGKLVPLGVSSAKRLTPFSDVPTMTEAGFPELEMTLWAGMLAPAGTPAEIIKRLNTELIKIINSGEIREQWANGGAHATPTTPEDFAAFIQSEQAGWSRLIKQSGVKMQ